MDVKTLLVILFLLCLRSADAQTAGAQSGRVNPNSASTQFNLGLTSLKAGHPESAIAHFQTATADPAFSAEAHYWLAVCYFQSGEFAKVPAELRDQQQSSHAEHVLFLLEESYRITQQVAEARSAFHQLNTRFPDSPWVHFLMGNAYESREEHEKAIDEYKAALSKDPKQPNANFAIGYIYWQDRRFEEAKLWLTRELDVQPCHALACYYLAETARTENDAETAARFYKQAIHCDDHNAKAHLGLGIVLTTLNQNPDALAELRRSATLNPNDSTAHYRLALLYKKLGQKKQSEGEYELVRKLHEAEGGDTPMASPHP